MNPTQRRGERTAGWRRPAALSLILLSSVLGLALSSPIGTAIPPRLTILSPAENAIIGDGSPVVVIFAVSDFNLTRPGTGGAPNPNEGHVNVFVDNVLTDVVSTLSVVLPLLSGTHDIRLQILADNGTALSPDVADTVRVVVTRGPAAGTPEIVITSPTEGSVRGTDAAVSFRISNFTLVPPGGPTGGPREGHIHVFVNREFYQELTRFEPVHLGLDGGVHNVTLVLVGNDHLPLSPNASATVHFRVDPAFGRATDFLPVLAVTNGLLGLGILGVLLFHGRKVKR